MNEIRRIAITGPTGALGMALISYCLKHGIAVLAICHRGSRRVKNIPVHELLEVWELNTDEYNLVEEMKEIVRNYPCEIFFHLAWAGTFGESRNDMKLQIKNIQYTLDAVSLAKKLGCNTFVGAGSQAEYGRYEGLLSTDTPTYPETGYGMAKLCAGHMSRKVCEVFEMRHIWVRILSIYGPYDGEETMVSSVIHKLMKEERVSLTPGLQKWDYLYSEDAAKAMFELAIKGQTGEVYVLGSGNVRLLQDYINDIADVIATDWEKKCELGFGDISYGTGQIMYLGADISKLQKTIDFKPTTPFKEGIRKLIEMYIVDEK